MESIPLPCPLSPYFSIRPECLISGSLYYMFCFGWECCATQNTWNLFRTTLEGETDLCYVCDHEWAGTAEHGGWRWSRNKSICCPRAGQDNPSGTFPQHAAVISHACRVTHKQPTVTDPHTRRSLPESHESVCYTAGDSLKSYKGLYIETILLGLSLSPTTHGAK